MVQYKRLSVEKRTQIICLSEQNIPNREIASRLGCNESTVRRFLKRYRESGASEGRKYIGKPKILNNRDLSRLKVMSLKNRFHSASKLRKDLIACTGKTFSAKTVQRRLNEMGLKSRRPAKKPMLTVTMRQKRLDWCKNLANWTEMDWQHIIFSDETKINLMGADGGARVRRRRNERFSADCILPTIRHSPSVMVWGAITAKGVGQILIIDGSINAAKYKTIIEKGVLPTIEELSQFQSDITFQDDSAPCHRAASIKKYKEDMGITSLIWPANSPDLNPIENLWAVMKRKIREKEPRSIPELRTIINDVWFKEINNSYIDTLYKSMPGRLKDVIKAKGGSINK